MELSNILPKSLYPLLPENFEDGLEEIRIRVGQEAELLYGDMTAMNIKQISEDELTEMLNYLSDYSPYALEEELRQGFFTIKGGHRVGVAGRTNRKREGGEETVRRIVDIGALNIRVAHEVKGCAAQVYPYIRDATIKNVFILAEPGMGKTTLLRDLVRLLSSGDDLHTGVKVAVVDERSEIAACYCGVPQNDLGPRVDVLDNCPKIKGMQMLLRTMSPQVIAVDELGRKEEFEAVQEILYSGCHLLATVHAGNVDELYEKPFMAELMETGQIERLVKIERNETGQRSYRVFDKKLHALC
ncbi:MAG: stage III sporulation protein AA [Agathobacter sp.]|nr:stage III sporulation protein AA [Agathobacter sp.]